MSTNNNDSGNPAITRLNTTVSPTSTRIQPTLFQRRKISVKLPQLSIKKANGQWNRSGHYNSIGGSHNLTADSTEDGSSNPVLSGKYSHRTNDSPRSIDRIRDWWEDIPNKLKSRSTAMKKSGPAEAQSALAEDEEREKRWNRNAGAFMKGVVIDGKFVILGGGTEGNSGL